MRRIMAMVLLVMVGSAGACHEKAKGPAHDVTESQQDNVTVAMANASDLSIARRLVDRAQLGPALDGNGSYTIFAPVDAAWSALGSTQLKSLESEERRPELIAVLRQHIASGYVLPDDLDRGFARKNAIVMLASMGVAPIKLRRDGRSVLLGQDDKAPRIVGAPITTGNDVIYRIDRLIPPPD